MLCRGSAVGSPFLPTNYWKFTYADFMPPFHPLSPSLSSLFLFPVPVLRQSYLLRIKTNKIAHMLICLYVVYLLFDWAHRCWSAVAHRKLWLMISYSVRLYEHMPFISLCLVALASLPLFFKIFPCLWGPSIIESWDQNVSICLYNSIHSSFGGTSLAMKSLKTKKASF